jgi:hypothetical protein
MSDKNNPPETNAHQPTVDLIMCAYPTGIPNAHYLTLLSILTRDTSIRVLARVIAHIRGGDYAVDMNDVLEAKNFRPEAHAAALVMEKLTRCGYEEWRKSET